MIVQTSYSQFRPELQLGELMEALTPRRVGSRVARGIVKAGYGVFKALPSAGAGSNLLDPGEVYHLPDPDPAADVDAIVTAITSSLSVQSFSGAALNGVVGAKKMYPPRRITLVLSNHADWDATNAVLVGTVEGRTVSENLAIPNGGNATVTSVAYFDSVVSLSVPAQSGTGGTATVGVAALASLTAGDFRGVALRQALKTTPNSSSLYGYPGLDSRLETGDYIDSETVPLLTHGAVAVFAETAVADGAPLFVRVAAGAGGSVLGAFRADADGGTCVAVSGVCQRDVSAPGPMWAHFG